MRSSLGDLHCTQSFYSHLINNKLALHTCFNTWRNQLTFSGKLITRSSHSSHKNRLYRINGAPYAVKKHPKASAGSSRVGWLPFMPSNHRPVQTIQAEGQQIKTRSGILHLLYALPGVGALHLRPARTLSMRHRVSSRLSGCPSLAHPALFIATGQLGISPLRQHQRLFHSSSVLWRENI